MKKIKIIVIALCALALTSCMNIDVEPKNSVTYKNYFQTEKDLQVFLNGIKYNYRSSVIACINFSDQVQKGYYADAVSSSLNRARQLNPGSHSPNNSSTSWNYFYSIIAGCNIFFENANKVDLAQTVINRYEGQAYFYRAHTYFWLAMNWGDCPIILSTLDIQPKIKSTFDKVLDQAINDAKKAIEYLPAYKDLTDDSGAPSMRRDLISKEAAYALIGYIYAWKASLNNEPELYTLAIDAISEVLKQEAYYDLAANPNEVCDKVLEGGHHRESIFEVHMSWNDDPYSNQITPAYYLTGFPVAPILQEGDIATSRSRISNASVDKMYPKGDLRREAYFYKTDEYRTEEWLMVTKGFAFPYKFRYAFISSSGYNEGAIIVLGNMKSVYRVADLLLLRAECYARTGTNDALAIADLNRVRQRSNASLYGVNTEPGDLRYTIFKEREKELIWENHRYFDIIRNGYYSEISEAYGKLTQNDIQRGAIYVPVGIDAFNDNPNMTQNAYWLSKF